MFAVTSSGSAWRKLATPLSIGFTVVVLAASPAAAGSFEDGVAAQSRGDMATAVSSFQDAANKGEDGPEFALGRIYLTGNGVAQDYRAARSWFEKAAAQGNPGAAYQLAAMCEGGLGGPKDGAAAARWYRQSAQRGFGPAEISLAEMYRRGEGVPRDLAGAIHLVAPQAEAGDVTAELELGILYADVAQRPLQPIVGLTHSEFSAVMDRVFGQANWRETGGYRTRAEEDRLRAAGAGTVPLGEISRHSIGTPDAPGAYDVVVAGMSADEAAARLRRLADRLGRVVTEGAHGNQGPHLHVEPVLQASYVDKVGDTGVDFIDKKLSGLRPTASEAAYTDLAHYWLQLAASNGEGRATAILAKLRLRHPPSQLSPSLLTLH